MKKLLPVIVAVLIAAFATAGIFNWAKKMIDKGQLAQCMVAARQIKAGEKLSPSNMTNDSVRIPTSTLQGGQVWKFVFAELTEPEKQGTLVNRVVAKDINVGTPIMESMLRPVTQEVIRKDWRTAIPSGRRAISIPVSGVSAVSGLVQVGDHVDILISTSIPEKREAPEKTMIPVPMGDKMGSVEVPVRAQPKSKPMTAYLPFLQDVEVLAIGSQTFNQEELAPDDVLRNLGAAKSGGPGVTIALKPDQIQLLTFAIKTGNTEFTLTLRGQSDRTVLDVDKLAPTTFDTMIEAMNSKR